MVAHVAMLACCALFLFPFAWMLGTSVKTDEELAEAKSWWPTVPKFCATSPSTLEFRALQLRTLDARVFNLFDAKGIASKWDIERGKARLLHGADGAVLDYQFESGESVPVVLRCDFTFPADASEWHKLMLAMKFDDSWHRLDATLDVGGHRWTSAASTWLAQSRAVTVSFQPPTFDDDTYQPRMWVPMRDVGISDRRGPRQATLRLMLSPSSTAQAIWAKLTRNYVRAFNAVPFWRYVANSVILVALTTLGMLFSSSFVAYAFARLHWPGRSFALVLMLSTMMLPPQVTMVPTFVVWRTVGWYNTLNPMWVPAFFGSAFFIFLMTQHMKTIPRELDEAARIDGLSHVQTWYYVILPQVKPAAAAIAIMTFMWSWNEFLGPLVYLRDQGRFPLSLGLFGMRLDFFGDWPLLMAGNVLMTLPVIVIFFFCQRHFVQGMTMSGMKG